MAGSGMLIKTQNIYISPVYAPASKMLAKVFHILSFINQGINLAIDTQNFIQHWKITTVFKKFNHPDSTPFYGSMDFEAMTLHLSPKAQMLVKVVSLYPKDWTLKCRVNSGSN